MMTKRLRQENQIFILNLYNIEASYLNPPLVFNMITNQFPETLKQSSDHTFYNAFLLSYHIGGLQDHLYPYLMQFYFI